MRAVLQALTDELQRLKAAGVQSVPVSDESLAALRRAVAARHADQPPAPAVAAPAAEANARVAPPPPSAPSPGIAAIPPPPAVTLPAGDKRARWEWLRDFVLRHPVCHAHVKPGKKVVFGVGDIDARIMFVGEAPGAEEEIAGEPFVGPAGQLLTRMIKGMGLEREQVYIGNIMNWRPEMPTPYGNRPPSPEEMAFCLPFLRAQIEVVQPELVVALGATAAGGLLGAGTFRTLGEIRGRWHAFAGKPVMVTYHPSYILRTPSNRSKRAIWEDLLKVMERAGLPVSDRQRAFFLEK